MSRPLPSCKLYVMPNEHENPQPGNRAISTEDGRKLCISEAGHPQGVPVLVLRGTPQSRLLYDGWIKDAQWRGIRLICYERPGYGGSSRQPGRSVASAA